MRIGELADLLIGATLSGDPDTKVTSIATDSRSCQQGALFICLPGESWDGHDFVEEAVQRGAVAIVSSQKIPQTSVPIIHVDDTRVAMAVIACHFYRYPSLNLNLIGITGTNGKTTISYLIEKVLLDAGMRTGMIGTIRTKVGDKSYAVRNTTPDCVELQKTLREMVQDAVDYCVMEVSSHALAMGRVKGCRFRTAVFSNLSQDHLDYHRSMEHYRWSKGLMFSRLGNTYERESGQRQYVVLNADDPASSHFRALTSMQTVSYGIDNPAQIRATQIRTHARGTAFVVEAFGKKVEFQLKLIGRFNVYNTLAAVATCLLEGIQLEQIRDSLEQVRGIEGRLETIQAGQDFTVIVDYAHTPDSMENVLSTISEFVQGRIICVFGCGGNRDRSKRRMMGEIAARYSDYVTLTSDNPRFENPETILDDIEAGLTFMSRDSYVRIPDRKQAIEHAIALARHGDVVLIAGKGHETVQEINGKRIRFDDRIEALNAIRGRRS